MSTLTPELKARLEGLVTQAPVVLFMKGTKNFPQCGFSATVVEVLKRAGVDAFGLVRVNADTAFRIEPADIPTTNGNFTHEELVERSTVVPRRHDGVWQFWRSW